MNEVEVTTAAEDDEVTLVATPEEHYTFTSYTFKKTSDGSEVNPDDLTFVDGVFLMPTYGLTISATFTAEPKYNLIYSANDGTDDAFVEPYYAGEKVTLKSVTDCSFSRDGYKFTGWNTAADGTGTAYAAGAEYTMPAKHYTMYAQWEAIPAHSYFDFSKASYSSASADAVTWNHTMVTINVEKDKASTNANNYLPPSYSSSRFYKNSVVTLTPATGKSIQYYEFKATTAGYAKALANSTWSNATASVTDETNFIVTITPTNAANAVSATIGGTCGFTKVTYFSNDMPENVEVSLATIGEKAYSTRFFDMEVTIPDDVKAYKGQVEDGAVKLTKVEGTIPANSAVMLVAETAGNYSFPVVGTPEADALTENEFFGYAVDVTVTKAANHTYLALNKNDKDQAGFFAPKGSTGDKVTSWTAKAYKAYIDTEYDFAGSESKGIGFVFDDDPTSISEVAVSKEQVAGGIFNLAGQKVNAPVKGNIYIVNGKKVMF